MSTEISDKAFAIWENEGHLWKRGDLSLSPGSLSNPFILIRSKDPLKAFP